MKYAKSKNLTIFDVVTIASMIEREAGVPKQRKLVASVIYNRLHEGMTLGIDSTIRFATGNYEKPLTESELESNSPYNTRTHAGLPPGPINSPGLAAMQRRRAPGEDRIPLLRQQPELVQRTHLRQDRRRIPRRRREVRKGARSERRQPADHLQVSGGGPDAGPGGDRSPGGALALAGHADGGARRARPGGRVDLRGDRRGAGGLRGRRSPSWPRRASTPGSTSPCRTRRRRWRWPTRRARRARAIGAANTLSFRDGQIVADNTDAGGLLRSLPHLPDGERALVLGAGGAARAAIWALADGRARRSTSGTDRRAERAKTVARRTSARGFVDRPGPRRLRADRQHDRGRARRRGRVRAPAARAPTPSPRARSSSTWSTPRSRARCSPPPRPPGATTVDGLEMLVQQGALSLRIWTGEEPSIEAMRTAVRR